ncbi:hypothetical protein [Vibrio parahaemolyticus]|uniref:hypothetical protein n=1 Tax=Vibrio parahaemolyticus TaxID=670 RepID=UPI00226ADF02|nr:hypothetical protein [Vibrio parahaemolyticus]MCX8796702.1 hypothetical protein [Vibrio parahaemolyticus]
MNEYGFVSANRFKKITELINGDSSNDFHSSRDKLKVIQGINPILLNNMEAYNLAISNPGRFDAQYGIDPLKPREIAATEQLSVSDLLYAPIGQVLYKTRDLGLKIPGDAGYDEYVKSEEIREIANKQISHAKTKEDLNLILSSNMKPDMMYEYGIDSSYSFAPLSNDKKIEIDTMSIYELANSSIAEVLYKTRKSGVKLFMPEDDGYEEWRMAVNYRDAAINQLNSTNNESEAKAMMNKPINKNQLDYAECENIGGVIQNNKGEWVKGEDYCIDKKQKENHLSLGF